jgi:hypothetical protein
LGSAPFLIPLIKTRPATSAMTSKAASEIRMVLSIFISSEVKYANIIFFW